MQVLDPPVSLADIASISSRQGPVGRAAANEVLKHLRRTVPAETRKVDLVDGELLDWKRFLQQQNQRSAIIGTGVTGFYWCRMFEPDYSASVPGLRCDFVVERHDGSAVRLHPQTRHDDILIFGKAMHWDLSAPPPGWLERAQPASNRGGADQPDDKSPVVLLAERHLDMYGKVDFISKKMARDFLNEYEPNMDNVRFPAFGGTLEFLPRDASYFQWWRMVAMMPFKVRSVLFGDEGGIIDWGES